MPRRKNYRKKPYKKRRYRRRKRATGLSKAIMATPFPKTMVTKLTYAESVQYSPAGTTSVYSYNANDIYDPNQTGTGAQPLYFDQLLTNTGPYRKFRVIGVGYKWTISNLNTPARWAVGAVNYTSSIDLDDLVTNDPKSRSGVINTMSAGGKNVVTVKGYRKIRNLVGESLTESKHTGSYNASPTQANYVQMRLESLDGATNMTSVNVAVKITYYVQLFDKPPVTGSA